LPERAILAPGLLHQEERLVFADVNHLEFTVSAGH
jgi:hypothetical protein